MNNVHEPDPVGDPEAPDSVDGLPVPDADEPLTDLPTERAPDDGKHTPEEWAQLLMPNTARGQQHPDLWKHGAADQLHDWPLYAHNNNGAIRLSQEDYEAALKAASTANKDGSY